MGRSHVKAKKCKRGGVDFASKFESEVYAELVRRQAVGEISELTPHPEFALANAHIEVYNLAGTKVRKYTADAKFVENLKEVVVEAKGVMTAESSLRISLFRALYPHLELRIIKMKKRKKSVKKTKSKRKSKPRKSY